MDDILHIIKYPSWNILWNKFGRHQRSSFRIAVCVSAVDYKENNYDLLIGKTVKVMEWQRGMICNKYWHHFWKYVHVMKTLFRYFWWYFRYIWRHLYIKKSQCSWQVNCFLVNKHKKGKNNSFSIWESYHKYFLKY